MDYLEIKAPAKINFGLFVTSKRPDGYHNLETIFYPINDLYDELFFYRAEQFEFTSNDPALNNKYNLIIQAKDLLEKQSGKKLNCRIELRKNIPIGAGLGGGSSDAATTLISLNEMFNLNYNNESLRKFALSLGSDVPFFIKPLPSFAESRGEALTLLKDFDINFPILVINPGIHISTKLAYQNVKPKSPAFNLRSLVCKDMENTHLLIKNVTNDFEEYAFNTHPEVEAIKEKMYLTGARFALMSGSGSTVYGIYESIEKAEAAVRQFPGHYFMFISSY
jgi:4-diphosphocytidyl-2-C-methyl-D-erythritol kinase